MTDPFATSRNGHQLENMYDACNNTLDIRYKGLYPSNVLSNLYPNGFRIDGVSCGSMEGFLQSLKYQDEQAQISICALQGGSAKDKSTTAWQQTQTLWWRGKPYRRDSEEFAQLIERAYKAMTQHNRTFRDALLSTDGIRLIHTLGIDDPRQTILTGDEFCTILTRLRKKASMDFMRRTYARYLIAVVALVIFIIYCCSGVHVDGTKLVIVLMPTAIVIGYAVFYHLKIHRLKQLARRL